MHTNIKHIPGVENNTILVGSQHIKSHLLLKSKLPWIPSLHFVNVQTKPQGHVFSQHYHSIEQDRSHCYCLKHTNLPDPLMLQCISLEVHNYNILCNYVYMGGGAGGLASGGGGGGGEGRLEAILYIDSICPIFVLSSPPFHQL